MTTFTSLRILYFHQHFTTPQGSGGTRSYEFARALIDRGHQVTMVCGRHESDLIALTWVEKKGWFRGNIDGIDVIALPLRYSNRVSIARRAWLFLRFGWRSTLLAWREQYDLLFATSTPLTAAVPGVAMKLLGRKTPFVFEVRDLWPELPRALGMRNPFLLGGMSLLEWLAYRLAQGCIALAPGIKEGILRRSPPRRKVAMIPNGCDLDLFHPQRRGKLDLPGIQPGTFVAGFTGAHGIANGLDAVLDAAKVLKERGRDNIQLLLIGDGNQKDRLMARARAEGLRQVLFIAPIRKSDVARITASLDCGLMILADVKAFYYGTSPNKFFDYISAGLPVICNYPGWLAGLIQQHSCGLVTAPGRPEELADALCQLAAAPAERDAMARRARQLAETDFGRPHLAAQFTQFIETMGKR